MFLKKKENKNSDKELLLNAMQQVLEGNHQLSDTMEFEDPEIINKFNEVITYFKRTNNNFLMRLNEAMEKIGDNSCAKNMLEQVDTQVEIINVMTESRKELELSINNITNEVVHIREGAQTAITVSEHSVSNMSETIAVVNDSVEEIRGINGKVQEFQEKIKQITNIIDMVKKLANQSGLLALNASIEAARAGEAGRGFSVVANEVKALSSNTTQYAETVVKYVEELQGSIQELVKLVNNTTLHLEDGNHKVQQSVQDINDTNEHMSLINERINNIYKSVGVQTEIANHFIDSLSSIVNSNSLLGEECNNTITHFYRIGRYVDTTRNDLAKGFTELTVQDWLRVFQIDHAVLTWRVYNNLAGFEHLLITQLNNPKGCKFGKWAQSQTDPKIVNSGELADVLKYHEALHKHACDSWYASEENNKDAALSHFQLALDNYNRFSNAIDKFKGYLKRNGYSDETGVAVIYK